MTAVVYSPRSRGAAWNVTMSNTIMQTLATHLKEMLDGCGLVQTSDTGQMNPATVTWPAADGVAGYLIYRFNDSYQGTDPVFLKFTFSRNADLYNPYLTVQIGQGSNGTGTLTGKTHTQGTGQARSVTTINAAQTNLANHGEGFFWFTMYAAPEAQTRPPHYWFHVERTRNQSTWAFDSHGVFAQGGRSDTTGNPSAVALIWSTTSGYPSGSTGGTYAYCLPVQGVTNTDSGDLVALPHFYIRGDSTIAAARDIWTAPSATLSEDISIFQASPFGTARWWTTIGGTTRLIRGTGLGVNNWCAVFPWEAP